MTDIRCVVDWPGTMSFIKDTVLAGAAIFTATVAYRGIHRWRGEESGKADFDLARRIGKATFGFRDALANARSPFVFAYEFPEDYDPLRLDMEGGAYAHALTNRFAPVRLLAIELQSLRNEAEALWGGELVEELNKLLQHASALHSAMNAFVSNKRALGEHFAHNPKFGDSIRAKVFDEGSQIDEQGNIVDEKNTFTSEIENAVNEVAAYLRTKLPSRTHRAPTHG